MNEFEEWLKREDEGKEVPLIDVISFIGRQPNLKPLGLMLKAMRGQASLADTVTMGGRRLGGPIVGCVSAVIAGKTIRECLQDGKTHAEALITTTKRLRPDMVLCTMPDLTVVAEACGCEASMPENSVPLIQTALVEKEEDIAGLEVPNPTRDGRMPEFLKSTQIVSEYFTLPASAIVTGPFSVAAQLGGVDLVSKKTIADPEFVKKLMDFALEAIATYAQALLEAGADSISIADPTASLLSGRAYKEFAAPYTRQLVDRLGVGTTLHICGRSNHIIDHMCATGVQGISVDAPVDLPSIVDRVPKDIAIIGNLSPVGVLLNGTPEEVFEETTKLIDSMRDVPNYVVASGCELSPETPLENIFAMTETVRSYN